MSLRPKPFSTSYPKWKHLKHGYTVKVIGVRNFSGDHGIFSVVEVLGTRRDSKLKATWPAEAFRRDFEPVGRKKVPQSAATRLLKDEE